MKLKFNTKKLIASVAGIVIVGAAAGYFFWGRQAAADEFLTAKIERGTIRNTVAATGTLQAVTTVQVGSQVSGTISALFADFNSNVRKGQVVAQLDPAILQSQVASARANLESARANVTDAQARVVAARSVVENQRAGVSSANANLAALRAQRDDARNQLTRQESLAASGIVPERDLETSRTTFRAAEARFNQAAAQADQARLSEQSSASSGIVQAEAQVRQAQAQVQQASASVQLAEVNLSHATIKSPIDGVVVSRNVDVGQTVAASLSAPTLFTIANDLTQMQVIANIDQADIGVIDQENRVNFTVDAFSGEQFVGKIQQIRLNPQNVQNVVTYNVVIDVRNPNLKLKPGMTANLTMTIAERSNALKIPNSAFRFRPNGMTQEQIRDLFRGGNREGRGDAAKADASPAAAGSPAAEKPAATPQAQASPAAEGGGGRRGQRGGGAGAAGAGGEARPESSPGSRGISPVGTALAEGQRRVIWLLGPDNKPQPRRVKVGITDGTATELVEGDLKEGDVVIVGQNVTGENRTQSGQRAPGFGGPQGGFGGGRPGGGPAGGGVRR
ncbi:MAG: efflux RND transporter periplasmic adaptor subunit [Acidobacteriota bacterium]